MTFEYCPQSPLIQAHTTISIVDHWIPSAVPYLSLSLRGGLGVGSVTTSESPLSYVLFAISAVSRRYFFSLLAF